MQAMAVKKDVSTPTTPPVVREYEIGDTKYIVSATSKAGATEDAAAKVRAFCVKKLTTKTSAVKLCDKNLGQTKAWICAIIETVYPIA